jgi:hypothetical protein
MPCSFNRKISFVLFICLGGCETWSRILWEEHRLKVFKNGVQRKLFRTKLEEVTRGQRKLHKGALNDLCAFLGIRDWMGHVTCVGEKIHARRFLVRKPEGKRPLGNPRHRWNDDSEIAL